MFCDDGSTARARGRTRVPLGSLSDQSNESVIGFHGSYRMADQALELILEMNRWIWQRFKNVLDDMTPEEAEWRPLPQANNINLIVRHLRIEAELHAASMERGEPMPFEVTATLQQLIDSVPLDFTENLGELERLYTRFVDALQETALPALEQRSASAYRDYTGGRPVHLLSFHQAVHLAGHLGQISSIRNLYRKTRGEPARFFPDNPTFPET